MPSLCGLIPLLEDRTVVRLLQRSDLERFHAYRSDPELARYQGWTAMTVVEAERFLEEMSAVSELRLGGWVQLAIADSVSNDLLGDVGLYVEADGSAAEIGFTLGRPAQGLGHAARAVRASLALVFAATGAETVRAVTDLRNTRSIRVLERANFQRLRVQETVFKGEPCTEWVYVFRRGDA